jgi:O-antigen/teichoic acid export membrane protein
MITAQKTIWAPESRPVTERKARVRWFPCSTGMKHSMVLAAAMILAGGLDYGVNVVAGRWLNPLDYGVFVSVTAVLQVLIFLSIAIRNVVAFYTAELTLKEDGGKSVAAFVQHSWRWATTWGMLTALLMIVASPLLASTLHLPNAWPVRAASPMVLLLFLRETTYGALQGTQAFTRLGLVQVPQAFLRIALAGLLIWLGGHAVGAIAAQPLSCVFGVALALWWLRPYFRLPCTSAEWHVSWHYSAHTVFGLAAFGTLINFDALFVKHFYSPQVAGNYGPVVTLAKIAIFLPWAIGFVVFPKFTRRRATGQDARPLVLLALAATLVPGLALTTVYFFFPASLVKNIFTGAYANPGVVLGLATLAASLYAGLNIWFNYALSLERRLPFLFALLGVLLLQAAGMFLFGRHSLVHMTIVMVAAALLGNVAGLATTWATAPVRNGSMPETASVTPCCG